MVSPAKLITEVLPVFPLLVHVNFQKGLSRQTLVCSNWLVIRVVQALDNSASNEVSLSLSFSFLFLFLLMENAFHIPCCSLL